MRYLQLRNFVTTGTKRYFRNRAAVWFSLVVPTLIMLIFGVLNFGKGATFDVGLVAEGHSSVATGLDQSLHRVQSFKFHTGSEAELRRKLDTSGLELIVIIPASVDTLRPGSPAEVRVITSAKAQNGQTAAQIASQVIQGFNQALTHTPQLLTTKTEEVNTKNLSYIDFLVPGIVAMSTMQGALFSVAFVFVQLKKRGVLRRLKATPINPGYFIAGEVISRLIVNIIQATLLIGIGVLLFHLHVIGSYLYLLIVILLGALVFLAIGFAIAGWAKDENQAAPLANLVALPMLFLSGVFFARDAMPVFLQKITDYLPLTYFADALRHIANDGSSLWAIRGDLLGLLVWGVLCYLLAIRLFRWE